MSDITDCVLVISLPSAQKGGAHYCPNSMTKTFKFSILLSILIIAAMAGLASVLHAQRQGRERRAIIHAEQGIARHMLANYTNIHSIDFSRYDTTQEEVQTITEYHFRLNHERPRLTYTITGHPGTYDFSTSYADGPGKSGWYNIDEHLEDTSRFLDKHRRKPGRAWKTQSLKGVHITYSTKAAPDEEE